MVRFIEKNLTRPGAIGREVPFPSLLGASGSSLDVGGKTPGLFAFVSHY